MILTPLTRWMGPLLAAAILLPAASLSLVAQNPQRPPNIILIMVDDMGYADPGPYGQSVVPTPHLDRLAAQGMRFTDAYSGSTVCAPARSVLMTGLHAGHTPVRSNTGGVPLPANTLTIASILKRAGYATGGFGKWGLGDVGTPGVPENHGFDLFFGYYHQVHAHYHYPDFLYRNSQRVALPGNEGFYDEKPKAGAFPTLDPATGRSRQYAPYVIFEEMLSFIRANKDQPFFVYAPWTPPHGRFEIPAEDPAWQLFKSKPWKEQAKVIAAMNAMIDRQLGQVLEVLGELQLDERTIVFFMSDNGAAERLDGVLDSSGPLRGRKRDLYEGGIRVPLIVRWPGRIEAGATSAHPTSFQDLLPTLAELARAERFIDRRVDGYSILPTLVPDLALRAQAQHPYLYWEYSPVNWKLGSLEDRPPDQALRLDHWKALRKPGQPFELYDLAADLGETTNLADQHPRLVAKINALMDVAHQPPTPQVEPEKPQGQRYR